MKAKASRSSRRARRSSKRSAKRRSARPRRRTGSSSNRPTTRAGRSSATCRTPAPIACATSGGSRSTASAKPEKVTGNDPAVFHYLVTGSGRCKLTRQVLEDVEGGRSSTDDFCRGKSGAELELLVRKAARANLDGNITRELAGMKSVPITEIEAAWVGTPKKVEQLPARPRVRHARRARRRPQRRAPRRRPADLSALPEQRRLPPAKGDRGAFYGCPNYQQAPNDKFIVNAAEWEQKQRAKAAPAAPAAAAPATNGAPAGRTTPPAASEIFGREPGQEG
jgi:hypothetical protein